jgi:curved DNA-binding protein
VTHQPFVDYYEVLQLSPRATLETVELVYRLLIKRYHPDNPVTGDLAKFAAVREAHEVLSSPERRAVYDGEYDEAHSQPKIFDQESAHHEREEDRRILHSVLSLLYVERRKRPVNGGLGAVMLERAVGAPENALEFLLWYMKQHRWIEVLDTGQIAITVDGIDRLADKDVALRPHHLLPESSARQDRDETFTGPRPVDRKSSAAG